jgi:hypothetical protein
MKTLKDLASEMGKKGGTATFKKYGPEHYRELGKKGGKKKKKENGQENN